MNQDPPHDLDAIRTRLRDFVAARQWESIHSPKNLAMALTGEAGELVALFQWLSDDEIRKTLPKEDFRRQVSDELADVLIYLIRLADVCQIDLLMEAWAKIDRNEERYPVELARGNPAKYTAYSS
jgi:dCTP diphosphatase